MISFYNIIKFFLIQIFFLLKIIIILFSFHSPRHYFLSGMFKIPEFYYNNYLKTDIINRNFLSISNKLENYYTLVNSLNIEKNRLVPGYINILNNVYDLTTLDSEKILFTDLMNSSLSLDPENIYIIANLIEINNIINPSDNDDLNLYEKAISINPSFKKIYIEGLKNALRIDDQTKIKYFCEKYNNSILGETKEYNKNYIIGQGGNKIGLYLKSENNFDENIYLNEGITLNKNKIIFNIDSYNNLNKFSILLPNNSNLVYKLNYIEIISDNNEIKKFNSENFSIISSQSIFDSENFFFNSSNSTNKLDIFLKTKIQKEINQIILHFNVLKSNFYNQLVC